jgi:hypothetical protein
MGRTMPVRPLEYTFLNKGEFNFDPPRRSYISVDGHIGIIRNLMFLYRIKNGVV